MNEHGAVISSNYDPVLRRSLLAQVIVGVFAALTLDGGTTVRVVGVAILAYWLSAAVIVLYRRHEPTKIDLAILRWGFWFVLAIAALRQAKS